MRSSYAMLNEWEKRYLDRMNPLFVRKVLLVCEEIKQTSRISRGDAYLWSCRRRYPTHSGVRRQLFHCDSTSHRRADVSSNGSGFPITEWRYGPNRRSRSHPCLCTCSALIQSSSDEAPDHAHEPSQQQDETREIIQGNHGPPRTTPG